MNQNKKFTAEKLIIALILSKQSLAEELFTRLKKEWGSIDNQSEIFSYDFTSYYEKEMGATLYRQIISFKALTDPEKLPEIKLKAIELEQAFRKEKARQVNIDPGLLSRNRLILASTKESGHRIPLRKGIYAEVSLIYHHQQFHPLPWTYPDYQSLPFLQFLGQCREIYKKNLKQMA